MTAISSDHVKYGNYSRDDFKKLTIIGQTLIYGVTSSFQRNQITYQYVEHFFTFHEILASAIVRDSGLVIYAESIHQTQRCCLFTFSKFNKVHVNRLHGLNGYGICQVAGGRRSLYQHGSVLMRLNLVSLQLVKLKEQLPYAFLIDARHQRQIGRLKLYNSRCPVNQKLLALSTGVSL